MIQYPMLPNPLDDLGNANSEHLEIQYQNVGSREEEDVRHQQPMTAVPSVSQPARQIKTAHSRRQPLAGAPVNTNSPGLIGTFDDQVHMNGVTAPFFHTDPRFASGPVTTVLAPHVPAVSAMLSSNTASQAPWRWYPTTFTSTAWVNREIRDPLTGKLRPRPSENKGHFHSMKLSHPVVVRTWVQERKSEHQIQLLSDYFRVIVQVWGHQTLKEVINQRNTLPYHDLDPRNRWPENCGIPTDYWEPDMAWESRDPQQQEAPYRKAARGWELKAFRRQDEPLPLGISCEDILRWFPNHAKGEILDDFIQNRMSGGQMFKMLNPNAVARMIEKGVISVNKPSGNANNLIYKRNQKRRRWLQETLGDAGYQAFINDPVKLRKVYTNGQNANRVLSAPAASANSFAEQSPTPQMPVMRYQLPPIINGSLASGNQRYQHAGVPVTSHVHCRWYTERQQRYRSSIAGRKVT
jgi:hypothetical protein